MLEAYANQNHGLTLTESYYHEHFTMVEKGRLPSPDRN